MRKISKSQKRIYFGMLLIALGVNFTTLLKDSTGSLGVVFIAIGGLLFISGIKLIKNKEENK